MDDNNEFFKWHRVAVRLLTGKIMYNIWQFQRAISDDCTCSLTEQNIAINDHSDAMILYIGHYRLNTNIKQDKAYLLIDGLKLENGILKEVGSNESDVFACWSTISFLRIAMWLGIQQRTFFYLLKARDIFLTVSEYVDYLNWYGSYLSILKGEWTNIMILLLVSQVLMNNHETPVRQTKPSNQLSPPHQDDRKTRMDTK